MNALLRIALFALLVASVFDPADRVAGLKVPLFVALWIIFILCLLFSDGRITKVVGSLFAYVVVFAVLLPLASVFWYFVGGNHPGPYDGPAYLKSFLFLTLAIVLAVARIKAVPLLSIVLSFLSAALLALTAVIYHRPDTEGLLWALGDSSGVFAISTRSYAGLSYSYVYFHTAPLLVISIAYFAHKVITFSNKRRLYVILLLLNLTAMVCSGTRNDLILGLVTPVAVFLWYSERKQRRLFWAMLMLGTVVVGSFGGDIIHAMLDPGDVSNTIKLTHLLDYSRLFSNTSTLLFGQGLGAYFYSTAFGTETSVTELTYLEFIRNFGLIIAVVYYALLLYPVSKLRKPAFREVHYLLFGYISYLTICISNPLLVSSSGMLVLAIVISEVFPRGERAFHSSNGAVAGQTPVVVQAPAQTCIS